jgi:hypothetical protein
MNGRRCHDSGTGTGEVLVGLDGEGVGEEVSVFVVDSERGG